MRADQPVREQVQPQVGVGGVGRRRRRGRSRCAPRRCGRRAPRPCPRARDSSAGTACGPASARRRAQRRGGVPGVEDRPSLGDRRQAVAPGGARLREAEARRRAGACRRVRRRTGPRLRASVRVDAARHSTRQDVVTDPRAVRHRVGQRQRGPAGRRRRGRAAPAAAPEVLRDGDAVVARTALGPCRARGARRSPRHRARSRGEPPDPVRGRRDRCCRPRHGRHEGRGRRAAQGGGGAGRRPTRDVTYVFYDGEEVEPTRNGLGRLARTRPEWLDGRPRRPARADRRRHRGRLQRHPAGRGASRAAWRRTPRAGGAGATPSTRPGACSARLQAYQPREVEVEGLVFREGLNAVGDQRRDRGQRHPRRVHGLVNYRFAPDKSLAAAAGARARGVRGVRGARSSTAPTAPGPGWTGPAAAAFVAAIGAAPQPSTAGPTWRGSAPSASPR